MIINLRGTNGSGKSTVVRRFLDGDPGKVISCYGVLGSRRPEAYMIDFLFDDPLFVLGPYETLTGGLDALGATQLELVGLLEKYSRRGSVLLEGVILSTIYGTVGGWLAANRDRGVVIVYLDTPLEECFRSLGERGANKGTAHVAEKFKSITATKNKFVNNGVRVEDVSRANAYDKICSWLR